MRASHAEIRGTLCQSVGFAGLRHARHGVAAAHEAFGEPTTAASPTNRALRQPRRDRSALCAGCMPKFAGRSVKALDSLGFGALAWRCRRAWSVWGTDRRISHQPGTAAVETRQKRIMRALHAEIRDMLCQSVGFRRADAIPRQMRRRMVSAKQGAAMGKSWPPKNRFMAAYKRYARRFRSAIAGSKAAG